MARGANVLLLGCSLAVTGCVTDGVQVRPIADASAKFRYSGGLLEQGRAQLALGNPGIALETFRTLQRQQPESADAFAGIAACYAAMGRYDLARANYEFALAYAPTDRSLLSALASSLDRLGEQAQATQIRTEIASMVVAPVIQANAEPVTPVSVPRVGSVTVKLPEPPRKPAVQVVAKVPPAPTPHEMSVHSPIVLRQAMLDPGASPSAPVEKKMPASPSISKPEPLPAEKPRDLAFAPLQKPAVQVIAKAPPANAPREMPVHNPVVLRQAMLDPGASPSAPAENKLPASPRASKSQPIPIEKPRELMFAPLQKPAVQVIAKAAPAPAPLEMPVPDPVVMRQAMLDPGTSLSVPAEKKLPTSPSASKHEPMPAEKPRELTFAPSEVRLVGGPYLARSSPGEVALITAPKPLRIAEASPPVAAKQPRWLPVQQQATSNPIQAAPTLAQATPRPTATEGLRWLPLKYASARPNIQLLNAARSQSLAARSRAVLLGRGWRKIEIGNARLVRERSVVLYTSARAAVAQRLAAHFRCRAVKVQGADRVVVLLGRDAARPKTVTARA